MAQKFTQEFEFHPLNLEVENEPFVSAKGESSINQEQIISTHHQEMGEKHQMYQKSSSLAKFGAIQNEAFQLSSEMSRMYLLGSPINRLTEVSLKDLLFQFVL
jgi:hypothetical protein